MKIITIFGTRPQFIKSAIFSRKISRFKNIEVITINTNQHYDNRLSDIFFKDLKIKSPDYNLDIFKERKSTQLSSMIEGISNIIEKELPDIILVIGDTTSALASALASSIYNIPLIHLEGGERTYNRDQNPEEINRIVIDHTSSIILTSTERSLEKLIFEGIQNRSKFVGDPLYDLFLEKEKYNRKIIEKLNLEPYTYHVSTLHRIENLTNENNLYELLNGLDASSKKIIFPVHPRLFKILKKMDYKPKNNLCMIDPLSYSDFQDLVKHANKVFTDSGGVMREAYFSRKPCIVPIKYPYWQEIIETSWATQVEKISNNITDSLDFFTPEDDYVEGLFGNGNSCDLIINEIKLLSQEENLKMSNFGFHPYGNINKLPKAKCSKFSYNNYKNMLSNFLQANYTFEKFEDIPYLIKRKKPFVLLRHDIDMSLSKALEIAKIESDLKIKSTFFFLLRNNFYNIFSKESSEYVNKIIELGHNIGLHFDVAAYKFLQSIDDICIKCKEEASILEKWFGIKIKTISFHRPNHLILEGNPKLTYPMRHTYMDCYKKDIKYISDSKGLWNNNINPLDTEEFKLKQPMQILTHPIWWNNNSTDPYQSLLNFLIEKKGQLEIDLAANCKTFRYGEFHDDK